MSGIPQIDECGEECRVRRTRRWGGQLWQGSWDLGEACGGAQEGKQGDQEGLQRRREGTEEGAAAAERWDRVWAQGGSVGRADTAEGQAREQACRQHPRKGWWQCGWPAQQEWGRWPVSWVKQW